MKLKEIKRPQQKQICQTNVCKTCPLSNTVGCYWYPKPISAILKDLEKEIDITKKEELYGKNKRDS